MRYSIVALIRGLTIPYAILIGAVIIGGAIAGAPIIAPYRVAHADIRTMWTFNTVTGEAVLCVAAEDTAKRYYMNCEYRGEQGPKTSEQQPKAQQVIPDALFQQLLKQTR